MSGQVNLAALGTDNTVGGPGGTPITIYPWAPTTPYVVDQPVTFNGQLQIANTAHTSGVVFDQTKWNAVGGAGGGAVSSFNGRTGAIALLKSDVTTTGLGAADISADAAGAAAAETARAQAAESLLAPKASPALTGNPTGPTQSALTNSTALATTAYTDSAVAVETTRAGGVEATKAPTASPTFTGTVTAPTPAVDDSTTKVATTAYVEGQVSATNPAINGTAAPGTSPRFARADHVHPTDTTRLAASLLGATSGAAQLGSDGTVGGPSGSALSSMIATGSAVTKTGAYAVTTSDHVILGDATAGGFILTLPTAVGFKGIFFLLAINSNTNQVTVATTSAQTINGASTVLLGTGASGAPYQGITLVSDAANWRIV